MNATQIVWIALLGVAIATLIFWYNQRFLGGLVRKLNQIDAISPETAVTLEELHCKLTPPLRAALREGGSLFEIVGKADGERYYLHPEKRDMAMHKYRKDPIRLPHLVLFFCILILTGVLFAYLYPIASEFLKGLF